MSSRWAVAPLPDARVFRGGTRRRNIRSRCGIANLKSDKLFKFFFPLALRAEDRVDQLSYLVQSAMTNDAVRILLCRQRSGLSASRASRAKPLKATGPELTLHGVSGTEID